jgi:hypothetical protein
MQGWVFVCPIENPILHICAFIVLSSNAAHDSGALVLACLAGVGAGLYLFYRGFILLRRRRLILDTPFSKVRSAAMGMVELSGQAAGPYTMRAPITARACYYYRTVVWEWKKRGRNTKWVEVAHECNHVPFFLDDHTGRVLVDPRQAELDLHCDFKQEFCDSFFTIKEPAPASVRNFLERYGIATRNKIRVEERCIKPKNALFILGTLAENSDIEVAPEPIQDESRVVVSPLSQLTARLGGSVVAGMLDGTDEDSRFAMAMSGRAPAQKVIRLSTAPAPRLSTEMSQQQRIAAAMMKAGITSPAAWAAAGLGEAAVAVSENPNEGKSGEFEQRPPVVLTKGTNDKAFMISWRSQREVARSLGWKCTLMIWGGAGVVLVSLYLLVGLMRLW